MLTIQAKNRDLNVGLDGLRKEGFIPAVFYGPKNPATSITIATKEFTKVWKEAGESSSVTLATESGEFSTMIHDVAVDPVTSTPMHVDFYVIDATKELEVAIPIEFTGVAPAVKGGLGSLVKVMHEVVVRALPKDLPHNVTVDISGLVSLDSQILAESVTLPKGVTLATKGSDVVAAVAGIKEEVESAPIDLSAIEVEKKGKKEEEGAEAEAK